ncbi:M23 family metallopeptidase [Fodinibius sp.]|uniref:M23 family metallopeptidase n=1 Tax=Fodinibius sp. TaxID=1872440 RepID=UPI002ACE5F72|nr:M23 family metallopeptidase [Fodinibius sp.]MDZ7660640.1 M23 family metallopeptidase [Fodinibius sp.]
MALNNYYYYDEQSCEFVPVEYNSLERIVYTACIWILCGVVLSGIGISILSFSVGTPAEIALKAENQELINQLKQTKTKIKDLDQEVDQLAKADNEMYRSVLGMEKIPYDERQAGAGGADVYSEFDVYSQETAEILKWTAENLESLERSINIQQVSFNEIKSYYNKNREKMKHIPAIKPTEGIILSGYGMRYHPVLGYERQHEGLDFRANVGSEIFATGDGVVKYAGLKGTYGRLLIIDHEYGYESYYAHLSSFAKGIKPGTKVKRGDLIGFTGESGMVEGPHLHYEVRRSSNPVDPLKFLFADTTPEEYMMYKEIVENNHRSMD